MVALPTRAHLTPIHWRRRRVLRVWRSSAIRPSSGGAAATAEQIRDGVNDVLLRHSIGGEAGANGSSVVASTDASMVNIPVSTADAARIAAAMQLYGVDTGGRTGMIVSAVHDERDVDQTVTAFEQALVLLQDEGAL